MVARRSASPEPVATVIDERDVGSHHRPSATGIPRPPIGPGGGFTIGGGSGLRQVRAVSFEASSLVDNFSSYKASGPPSRVLYYGGAGAWADFIGEALASLRKAFEDGRTSVELQDVGGPVGGGDSVVDFLRMLQTDLGSAIERSVAWIDVHGRCFFPKRVVGGGEDPRSQLLEVDVVGKSLFAPTSPRPPSPAATPALFRTPASQEVQSGETATAGIFSMSTNPARNGNTGVSLTSRWDDSGAVQAVDRAADYFKHVERLFLSGMRTISPDAAVTAVRRCTHAGAHGGARLRAFVAQAQFTKSVRRGGDALVRASWYPAATPDEVSQIVRYGFGKPNCDRFGENRRYGSGVYLIPPQSMHFHPSSYVLPDQDVNGERHLLLCRTVLGSMETVQLGSWQSHPSGDQFDTGVDDPLNPRIHIIWTTKMNTHIIPECVVSFRCSATVTTQQQPALPRKPPQVQARRPWNNIPVTFLQLFAEIRTFVPPPTMRTLDVLLEQYKARKITRDAFIRHLRSVAGSGVLAETIKRFKKHE